MEDRHNTSRRSVLKATGGAIAGLGLLGSATSASAEPAITSNTIELAYTNRYTDAVDSWWQPRTDIHTALENKFDRETVTSDPNDNYSIKNQDVEYFVTELDYHTYQSRNMWDLYLEGAITDEVGTEGQTSFVVLDYLPEGNYDENDPLFFQPIKPWEFACAVGINWRFVEERNMDLEEKYPDLYWDIQGTTPPTPYPPYTDYGYDDEAAAVTYSLLQTLTAEVFDDPDYGSALTSMPYAGGMAGPWGSGVSG